ncbi:MAG: hypothetical protein KGZ34_03300 [Nitrosarchaeum sp.]|nr:hypothetical protein [Nitrosarchaeum sp.]
MDSNHEQKMDSIKHCQVEYIRICTRCGSTNVKIVGDVINCNDCNAILCFEHKA